MKLYFIHRDPEIQNRLSRVMPDASWEYRIPNHLRAAMVKRVEKGMAATLMAHLRTLPDDVQKVSTRQIKSALGLAKDDATKKAFTRAVQSITSGPAREWALEGQSLVRGFTKYFGEQPTTGT